MASVAPTAPAVSEPVRTKPGLVFFHSAVSGSCRRVEGFLAQVLQRRQNHGTFKLYDVAQERRPDLVERFEIEPPPFHCFRHCSKEVGGKVLPTAPGIGSCVRDRQPFA